MHPVLGGIPEVLEQHVGVIDDFKKSASLAFKKEGEAILVIGEVAALANADALADIAETNLKRSAA